ncbi:MAG: SDR family oxidoreductase [Marinosulfonomonas sp.]
MKVDLTDSVVLVTGAAAGIGRAIASQLSRSGVAGLMLTDRDAEGLLAVQQVLVQEGTTVGICVADLAEPAAPSEIAQATLQKFGRIDGLVNAAGLTTRASFQDGTAEIWDTLFAVNARAAFFLMQAAISDMKTRNAPGSIVNIQSVNVHCGAPELAIYSASKGALQTLTKNAAHAHMADRIRVNGINLGWVPTDGEHHMQANILGQGPEWEAKAAASLPLGRMVQPDEAARLAVYLLSDASVPMSGVALDLEQKVLGNFV